MFQSASSSLAAFAAKFSFDTLVWMTWGTFIAIFILVLTLTFALPTVRAASKRPFLCLVFAYTATTFALFLTVDEIEGAAFVACIFWIAGYLLYGILCAISRERKLQRTAPAQVAISVAPAAMPAPVAPAPVPPKPSTLSGGVARNNVRLEHAIAVTNKLLEKNLGKTDRQELEKLKNTLEVLKVKGTLTPAEGELLNENFNTLLKLMAKYNI